MGHKKQNGVNGHGADTINEAALGVTSTKHVNKQADNLARTLLLKDDTGDSHLVQMKVKHLHLHDHASMLVQQGSNQSLKEQHDSQRMLRAKVLW